MTFLTEGQQADMANMSKSILDGIQSTFAMTSTYPLHIGDWTSLYFQDEKPKPSISPLFTMKLPPIRNVIFNNPATIVYWDDGTKTVVKCGENDSWDAEKGLAMAVAKRAMGNKGNYNKALKRWLEGRSERSETTRSEMKATGG